MSLIRFDVHVEELPDRGCLSWWAESPDLPGFVAADHDLPSLLRRVAEVIEDEADTHTLSAAEDKYSALVWRRTFGELT